MPRRHEKVAWTTLNKKPRLRRTALLTRRRSKWGTRNFHQIIFRKLLTIYIYTHTHTHTHTENVDQ